MHRLAEAARAACAWVLDALCTVAADDLERRP